MCGWGFRTTTDERVAAAKRDLDLDAARLAAAGDGLIFTRLAGQIRGPRGVNLTTVRPIGAPALGTETAHFDDPLLDDDFHRRVLALAEGDPDSRFHLFRLAPHGLFLDTVTVDGVGAVRVQRASHWSWRAVGAGLPEDPAQGRFHLAGGVGNPGQIEPARVVADVVSRLAELGLPSDAPIVLVAPQREWLLLRRLAAATMGAFPAMAVARADSASSVEVLGQLVPLRYDYDLVVADVATDGTISVAPQQLFARGEVVDGVTGSLAECTLQAPTGARGPLVLAVVARTADPPESWIALLMAGIALDPGTRTTVKVQCTAPGQVRFVSPRNLVAEERTWREVCATVPPRHTRTIELICAVDISGAADAAERLTFAGELLDALLGLAWVPDALRVAVLGYRQHQPVQRRQPSPVPIQLLGFADPVVVRESLGQLSIQPNIHDLGSALEDALDCVSRLPWSAASRRVLVTVGSRPPHPAAQGRDHALPCPAGLDWSELAADLTGRHRVECITVEAPSLWGELRPVDRGAADRREKAWTALGQHGRYRLGGIVAADLLAAADVHPDAGIADLRLGLRVPYAATAEE